MSYYVIRLAGTPNESCGNLSALWIAPLPASIYHPPPSSLDANTHGRVAAGVDGTREMDGAGNEIWMLNTPAWRFFVIWSEHTGFSQITQRETEVHREIFLPASLRAVQHFLDGATLKGRFPPGFSFKKKVPDP